MFGNPQLRDIKVSEITKDNLEYFCKTSYIDKIRLTRMKKPFDQSLADAMEAKSRHYFVVLKNRIYDVLPGYAFEKKLVELYPDNVIIHGDVDYFPKIEDLEKIIQSTVGTTIEFIEPIHQNLTAKAAACIDHYIKKLG
jgi:hypothetical protein